MDVPAVVLTRMIHEPFCYNRLPVRGGTQEGRSAATTSLRPAGSQLLRRSGCGLKLEVKS